MLDAAMCASHDGFGVLVREVYVLEHMSITAH